MSKPQNNFTRNAFTGKGLTRKGFTRNGFTAIEVLSVMAVITLLVTLAAPLFAGRTKQAELTRLSYDAKLIETASANYFIFNNKWPKASETPLTKSQILTMQGGFLTAGLQNPAELEPYFYERINSDFAYNNKTYPRINLYPVDMNALASHIRIRSDGRNFVLRNPVGKIYIVRDRHNARLHHECIASNYFAMPDAAFVDTTVPVSVTNPEQNNTWTITPSEEVVCALDESGGTVVFTEPGSYTVTMSEQETGTNVSQEITVADHAISIDAGRRHSLALTSENTVFAWGDNSHGQIGVPGNEPALSFVDIPAEIIFVSAGENHSLVIDNQNRVWGWGDNNQNQLGIPGGDRFAPVILPIPAKITNISAGDRHSLAIDSDGNVWAWGRNNKGQLGISGNRSVPVALNRFAEIVSVSAGITHSLALDQDGFVWAWGDNSQNQLGIPGGNRFAPVRLSSPVNIISISAGDRYSLALDQNGDVWAWGKNHKGQLGIAGNRSTPTLIPLSDIIAISAGHTHSLALDQGGAVWAFGSDINGELGSPDGNPGRVSLTQGQIAISAGWRHSLSLDGTIWAWGRNNEGQLGDNSNSNSPVPVSIAN